MQIFVVLLLFLALLAFIIYKVNNQFEKKEFIIFSVIVVISLAGYLFYDKQKDERFPKQFQSLYLKAYNNSITNLSYELLNNKNISSKNYFVYKFTYVINKENKNYICVMPKVEIEKIGKEFVFKNFSKLQEECQVQ